jgi:hypothetical protein
MNFLNPHNFKKMLLSYNIIILKLFIYNRNLKFFIIIKMYFYKY